MNNRGFTLVELMIAVTILLIVSLGFFSWAGTVILSNVAMEKMNTANSIALDVADRLQGMPDNALVQAKTSNDKYVGFDASGVLRKCISSSSAGDSPAGAISTKATGLTEYTDPLNSSKLYLYDNNMCSEANPSCFSGTSITTAANANIDHPNTYTISVQINPVRFVRNTTYYTVWSVAYLPCNPANKNKRKIFITVYWIDPEPAETSAGEVSSKLASGMYTLKSVSLVTDKVIGVE